MRNKKNILIITIVIVSLILPTFLSFRQKSSDTNLLNTINELYLKDESKEDNTYLKSIIKKLHLEYKVDIALLQPFEHESYLEYYNRIFTVYHATTYIATQKEFLFFESKTKANRFATEYLTYQSKIDSLGNDLFTSMGMLYFSKGQPSHFISVIKTCIKENRYDQWKDMMLEHSNEFYAVSLNFNIPYEYLLAIGFQEMMTAKPEYVELIWTASRILFNGQQNGLLKTNNPVLAYLASSEHTVGLNSIKVDVAYPQYVKWQKEHTSYPELDLQSFQILLETDPVFNTTALAIRIKNEQTIHSKDLEITDNKLYIANSYNGNPLTKYYGEKVINYMNAFNDLDIDSITNK